MQMTQIQLASLLEDYVLKKENDESSEDLSGCKLNKNRTENQMQGCLINEGIKKIKQTPS